MFSDLNKDESTEADSTFESVSDILPGRSALSSGLYLTHVVDANFHGIRLDAFLKQRFRRTSREELKRCIISGDVLVRRNQSPHLKPGKPKPSSQLLSGDEVLIYVERKVEPKVRFDYEILYEDDALFVINKPPLLPVHPAGRYFFNTLLIHLKTHGHRTPLKANQNYYLVHRIDKETSGVLVLAKTQGACAVLTKQFAERKTQKKYLAIVHGIAPDEFSVDLALKRGASISKINLKMTPAPEEEGGLPAFTSFRRLRTAGGFSLMECFPKTGRQHQIRAHLDAAGFPIVGDKLYGLPDSEAIRFFERQHLTPESEAKLLLPRHALHSAWIQFVHPTTNKETEFSAPLPQDLELFLEKAASGPPCG